MDPASQAVADVSECASKSPWASTCTRSGKCVAVNGGAIEHFDGFRYWYRSPNTQDPVNNPLHYKGNGMETIDVIESFELGFHLGAAVKYILRAGKKGDAVEDLRKALWFIERDIKRRTK